MWIKYQITDRPYRDYMIALKYNPKESILVIGGRLKFYDKVIRKIVESFCIFDKDGRYSMISTFPNHSTIRCQINCSLVSFNNGLRKLKKDDSISIQSVHHLGRIMR